VSFIWVFSQFDRMDVGKQQGERGQLVEEREPEPLHEQLGGV
jgi:hypothetical protein